MVEVKRSSKPLGFANGSFPATRWLVRDRDDILKSLMISLLVKVTQILIERVVQGTLAEENRSRHSSLTERTPYGKIIHRSHFMAFILPLLKSFASLSSDQALEKAAGLGRRTDRRSPEP